MAIRFDDGERYNLFSVNHLEWFFFLSYENVLVNEMYCMNGLNSVKCLENLLIDVQWLVKFVIGPECGLVT